MDWGGAHWPRSFKQGFKKPKIWHTSQKYHRFGFHLIIPGPCGDGELKRASDHALVPYGRLKSWPGLLNLSGTLNYFWDKSNTIPLRIRMIRRYALSHPPFASFRLIIPA
jgi:hypothetical protein